MVSNHGNLMNVLADFVKITLLKQASFDLHQRSAIYLKEK